jgi:hypothetical protein
MNKKLTAAILLAFFAINLLANPNNTPAAEKGGVIKGVVFDASSKAPIEYATIAIYNALDNSVVTGTVTNPKGEFRVTGINDGAFYVVVSFLGYNERKFNDITINKTKHTHDLGRIVLAPSTEALNEVEVVAERKSVEFAIDKKIVSVGKQATVASMTAVEVLENVPSVKVDIEGNVSLRGSTGFTVLIDGKPTILEPSDALRQIPASTIDNIEIITNPSVKYSPEGNAGIINVITKKNKSQGINGQANANLGMYGTHGGDLMLNLRRSIFNFSVGADYNKRVFPGTSISERRTTRNDVTNYIMSNGESERNMTMYGFRGAMEVDLGKKDYASIGMRYGDRDMANSSNFDYREFTVPASIENRYRNIGNSSHGGNFLSVTGTYQHKFNDKGHELKTQFDWSKRDFGSESINELRTADGTLAEGKKNIDKGPHKSTEIRIDYTYPISKTNKFETGFQGRLYQGESVNQLFTLATDLVPPAYIFQSDYSNGTEYTQDIYAIYGMYSGSVGKFGYQAGLRGEYTDRVINTITDNQEFTIDRMDYFPTLHFSYSLPKENQVMLSYARRIQRARGHMLAPFRTWTDAYNVREGNPDLKDELIDSYELGYMKTFKKAYFSLEAYYRITHDKDEYVQSVYTGPTPDNSGKTVFLNTPQNIGKDYSLGLEGTLNLKLIKWWEANIMGNFYNYKIEGAYTYQTVVGTDIVTATRDVSNETLNWGLRFNNNFQVRKNIMLQLNSNYNSPSATAQGESAASYSFDGAVRMELIPRKFTAVMQVRDMFGTSKWERTSEGPNFYSYNKSSMKSPIFSVTLTYRFNNYRPSRRNMNNGEPMDMGMDEF